MALKLKKGINDIINGMDIDIPDIQRYADNNHVDSIVEFHEQYYTNKKYYIFLGVITFAKIMENNMDRYYLIDGQHRFISYKKLHEKYPEREMKIDIEIVDVSNKYEIDQLYKIINSSKPNHICASSIKSYGIINTCCKMLRKDFGPYIKTSASPRKPYFNIDNVEKYMNDCNIVNRCKINDPIILYGEIIEINKYYSKLSSDMFVRYGISNINAFQELLDKNNSTNKLYLSLYPNFEWIDRIIDKIA